MNTGSEKRKLRGDFVRLFIGIALPEAAREALSKTSRQLQEMIPGRFASPALYHITLAFIGEADKKGARLAMQALSEAAALQAPFSLSLDALSSFGSILYCGITPHAPLIGLAESVRKQLGLFKISFDPKPFRPHITLARESRMPTKDEIGRIDLPSGSFEVYRITLYESVREQGTLRYRPLHEAVFPSLPT